MPEATVTGFAAIRGHTRVCDALRAAVTRDRLPHALLFAGPEGVGKRSVALALVAWLLCEQAGDDACGRCTACRQVAARSHPDFQLLEVPTGKKEIGVDRIRDIKRFTQLQPVAGRWKAAVIDDAHMLTVAAQNALLKTLEEPPDRSLLILVAHTADALLPTVRSRCQRLQFAPLPNDLVTAVLTEQHGVPATLAGQLATLVEGSPGRALALSGGGAVERREDLLQALAGLPTAGYVRLVQLIHDLTHPEAETPVKLDLLLSRYRDEAVQAVGAAASTRDLRAILQRADAVLSACGALRRGTPNRQLLIEALVLRLAQA